MTEYEAVPGWLYHMGKKFSCPCGNEDFRVEVGTEPPRFWCTPECGAYYTEFIVSELLAVEDGA